MAGPSSSVAAPRRSRSRSLLALSSVIVAATIPFLGILYAVVAGDQLVRADAAISRWLQETRSPWADAIMVVLTSLGDTIVIVAVAAACVGWMLRRGAWRLASGMIIALLLAEASVYLLKTAIRLPRPETLYTGADSYSFPSGHATMSATLFGILAWLMVATMHGSCDSPGRRHLRLKALSWRPLAIRYCRRTAYWRRDLGDFWPRLSQYRPDGTAREWPDRVCRCDSIGRRMRARRDVVR
jgi:membrane-associated phospholipid phosphatase